jgi:NADPH:quinone reductase
MSAPPGAALWAAAIRAIRPRIAERISFDQLAEAHRRLEEGGHEGKLVLYPDLPSRRHQVAADVA